MTDPAAARRDRAARRSERAAALPGGGRSERAAPADRRRREVPARHARLLLPQAGLRGPDRRQLHRGRRGGASARRPTSSSATSRCPTATGSTCCARSATRTARPPVIMITAHTSTEDAIEAMKRGAVDYISKPFNNDELVLDRPPGARREAAPGREHLPAAGARRQVHLRQHHRQGPPDAGDLPHDRADRQGLLDGPADGRERHRQGAHRPRDPLLLDPQGPASSSRSTAARCPRRCSSPSSSATSAAPSPAPCARRAASSRKPTAARSSSTRSPRRRPTMQVKLLRAIQEKLIRKVGGNDEIRVDVRIIAATNKDLTELVARGQVPRGPLLPHQRHPDRRCRRCARAPRTSRR